MKKILLSTLLLTGILFIGHSFAQVRVNLNINLGNRPSWGIPGNVRGDFYYLPEIDCYYDIPQRQFLYFDGRGWRGSAMLPDRYRQYDLYRGFKVMINQPRPYLNGHYYRNQYLSYYNNYHRNRAPQMMAPNYPNRYDDNRYDRRRENDWDDNRYDNSNHNRNERGRDNFNEDRNRRQRGRG